jgi:hypothetical protein
MGERHDDDPVRETREKLERAEDADPAERADALEEMHRSLETELERPESEEPRI